MKPRSWWLAALLLAWPLGVPQLDRADSIGYLAPALSIASDGDLHYFDEYRQLGLNQRYFRPTNAGLPGNHWSPGWGITMLPTCALAVWLDRSGEVLSSYVGACFQVASSLLSLLLLLSLWGIGRALRNEAEPETGRLDVLVPVLAYLGTPVAYYGLVASYRPHLLEATLASWLLWLSMCWFWRRRSALSFAPLRDEESNALPRWAVVGALMGWMFLVRTQSVVVALPAVALAMGRTRTLAPGAAVTRWGVLVGCGLPFFFLSRSIRGLLYPDGGAVSLLEALTEVDVDVAASLFHPHHGLFAWSPLLAFACVGLVLWSRREPTLFGLMLVVLVVEGYLNATSFDQQVDRYHYTRHWAGGASFGARRYASCLPLFSVGLFELVARVRQVRARWVGWAFVGVLVACTTFEASLALSARAFPHEVLEAHATFRKLGTALVAPLRSPDVVLASFRAGAPSVIEAALALLTVALPGAIVFALGRLTAPRLSRRARKVALGAGYVVFTVLAFWGVAVVSDRTRAAADARAAELRAWRQTSARRTRSVQRGILLENAGLRALVGRGEAAIGRYEAALALGLDRRAVVDYLRVVARFRGKREAHEALATLRARHPGHPVLKD